MTDAELITTRHFDHARDFLEALRPVEAPWRPPAGEACRWLFRGQSDAAWPLIPVVWRQRHEKLAHLRRRHRDRLAAEVAACREGSSRWRDVPIDRLEELIGALYAEFAAVQEYAELADEIGLLVPDYEEFQAQQSGFVGRVFEWGGLEPNQAYAIAQHHGIPTRLLDWTRKPLVAAFFAADATRHDPSGEALAVYAIDQCVLTDESTIRKLLIPRHINAYLHAQAALLTWCRGGEDWFCKRGDWPTYEDVLRTPAMHAVLRDRADPVLLKYTLPRAEATELLRLLLIERISRAHLMPTFDNVTRTIEARWDW